MTESVEEFKIVDELKPDLRGINIKVKCSSINDEKEIVSRKTGEKLRVTEALVGDETGSIYLSLWNDDIDKIEMGHVYQLTNVYTKVFKGSLRLNIGRYGSFEEINGEENIEINIENNLSDKYYEEPRRYRSSGYNRGYGNSRFSGGRKSYKNNRRSSYRKWNY